MLIYITLLSFTQQRIENIKESPAMNDQNLFNLRLNLDLIEGGI